MISQTAITALLMAFLLVLGCQAHAWSCEPVRGNMEVKGEKPKTQSEILRRQSKGIATFLQSSLRGGGIVVVGRFMHNAQIPFFHEDQLESIRRLYWPSTKKIQMPYQIEFVYPRAFNFVGHELVDAGLVPFSSAAIDARISIFADYYGIVDVLPPTETDVIGVLKEVDPVGRLELSASFCPSYFPIEPAELTDLLDCYDTGSC